MINKFNTFNRPISPHLAVYAPQISSLFSIWHRITGIILISFIAIFLLTLKTFLILSYDISVIFIITWILDNSLWFRNFVYISSLFIFLYHALNGIRHIIWDMGFLLNLQQIHYTALFSICIILIILTLNIANF